MGKRKLVIFDFDETFLLTKASHGAPADSFKNPHRLLPLMLFMRNSPFHKTGILTNRSPGNEKEGLSSLDANKRLESMGISIDERYIIRRPADYGTWTDNALLNALNDAAKLPPSQRAAAENAARKKFGVKNHRLEQMRQRAAIEEGIETPIKDTIMVDDSQGVIDDAKIAGYDAVKATEFNKNDSTSDNNSNYLIELGQKIGLDEYLDDLIRFPTMHYGDSVLQMAGALMYGMQTLENFNPPFSDYLKRMTYSEKQQVKAMLEYIKGNRPDYENNNNFKAFEKALPSDSVAKKNEKVRFEENEQFLKEAPGKFRVLLAQYDAAKKIDNEVVCERVVEEMEEISQRVRALVKDNNPQIKVAAKALSEQLSEHKAVTKSHLKQLASLQKQLATGIVLSDKEFHQVSTVLAESNSLQVRTRAQEVLRDNAALSDKAIIRDLQTAYQQAKGDDNKLNALRKDLAVYSRLPENSAIGRFATSLLDTVNDDIKAKSATPTQLAIIQLKRDLKEALGKEMEQGYGKALMNRFFEDVNLQSVDSIKKHLAVLKRDIQNIERNPDIKIKPESIVSGQMLAAIDKFTRQMQSIEGPSPKRGPLPENPVVKAAKTLNEQSKISWEIKIVQNNENTKSTQLWSPPMNEADAKKLLSQLNGNLDAKVISSTQVEGRFRVAIEGSKAVAVMENQQRFTAPPPPPDHRPPAVVPGAKLSASTRSSSSSSSRTASTETLSEDSQKRSSRRKDH